MLHVEKAVYKLNFDAGRSGSLDGLFIEPKEHVKKLIESQINVYFGEVLGKHSEIYGPIGEDEITLVSDSPEVIKVIEDYDLENGYNPFEYTTINTEVEDFGNLTVNEVIEILLDAE